jgi:hypothetical protein
MSRAEVRELVAAIYAHDSDLGGNIREVNDVAIDVWGNSAAAGMWTLAPALAAVEAFYDLGDGSVVEWRGGGEADGSPRPVLPPDITSHIRMAEQLGELS